MTEYTFIDQECSDCRENTLHIPKRVAEMEGRPICSECAPTPPEHV